MSKFEAVKYNGEYYSMKEVTRNYISLLRQFGTNVSYLGEGCKSSGQRVHIVQLPGGTLFCYKKCKKYRITRNEKFIKAEETK